MFQKSIIFSTLFWKKSLAAQDTAFNLIYQLLIFRFQRSLANLHFGSYFNPINHIFHSTLKYGVLLVRKCLRRLPNQIFLSDIHKCCSSEVFKTSLIIFWKSEEKKKRKHATFSSTFEVRSELVLYSKNERQI